MLKLSIAILAVAFFSQNSFALDCHGTEPFWAANLTQEQVKLVDPVVQKETLLPVTRISRAAGYTEEFLSVYSNGSTPVATVRKTDSCNNGMSEETYPQEVILFNGEETLYGCCGEPLQSRQDKTPCGDAETASCHP